MVSYFIHYLICFFHQMIYLGFFFVGKSRNICAFEYTVAPRCLWPFILKLKFRKIKKSFSQLH